MLSGKGKIFAAFIYGLCFLGDGFNRNTGCNFTVAFAPHTVTHCKVEGLGHFLNIGAAFFKAAVAGMPTVKAVVILIFTADSAGMGNRTHVCA